ncbi:hypothetical protein [Streptomyces melanogenes]|uniref:hypothetical protein n=1 Tax=Streptomyces melanogenes TaxID=67326 RepID=UPI00167CFE2E|nr:hypothetical protein [Streptomyces melanogenes]GGP90158.1 hypothetical protein GCM10010278_80760 [Streptomyces melanogenes]
MPQTTPPQPVQGWFIPAPPTAASKPAMPLLLRLVLIAAVILAVVLASHASADRQADTPPQGPPTTTVAPNTP